MLKKLLKAISIEEKAVGAKGLPQVLDLTEDTPEVDGFLLVGSTQSERKARPRYNDNPPDYNSLFTDIRMGNSPPRPEVRPNSSDDEALIDVGPDTSVNVSPMTTTTPFQQGHSTTTANPDHFKQNVDVCVDVPFTLSVPLLAQVSAPGLRRDIDHVLRYEIPDLKRFQYDFVLEKSVIQESAK